MFFNDKRTGHFNSPKVVVYERLFLNWKNSSTSHQTLFNLFWSVEKLDANP